MKKTVLYFLILIILACKQPINNTKHLLPDSSTKSISSQKHPSKEAIPTYDSTIYKKRLSPSVFMLLYHFLPEWKLPASSTWDKFWFDDYLKNGTLVNYITSDFNGDHKPDYALILKNKKKFAVWVLQSHNDNYEAIKLYEIGDSDFPIEIGLDLTPKGKLNYIDVDNDNPNPIDLKNDAISIDFFEKGGDTYYWKNGKYESVTTGD